MATASGLQTMPTDSSLPVGIFDSGVGGLSVLRHIRTLLPAENLLYFADSGYAPYGDKTAAQVIARSAAIASFLTERGIKALVVACNTATAIAVDTLRQQWPGLVIIGVEPGLKPAAHLSASKIVGVLATHGTLHSQRFAQLQQRMAGETGTRFLPIECIGLADQIEKGALRSPATAQLLQRYALPALQQGADTLVLGCTHYPFIRPLLEETCANAGYHPTIVDTGEAVARQLHHRLDDTGLLHEQPGTGQVSTFTTGSKTQMTTALAHLLHLHPSVTVLS